LRIGEAKQEYIERVETWRRRETAETDSQWDREPTYRRWTTQASTGRRQPTLSDDTRRQTGRNTGI